LPVPTFVIVKGGAVAGGCMFSFSHDFVYVADKALFMCNEVDIGLPLPPGMFAVIKKKHTNYQSLRDMCLMGRKFTA
jgi:enoyl-CoA hydratase/carnithine racemase